MPSTLFTGILIALSFSAPPGPVTFETIRRGLRGGFRPALAVQLGSIVGDTVWCALALFGLAPLTEIVWARAALGVAGVCVLLWLGMAGLRDAFRPDCAGGLASSSALRSPFRSGMAISLANPMAIGYWLSIGGVMLAAGVAGTSARQTATFVAGFIAGTFAWAFFMAIGFRWLEGALKSGAWIVRGVTGLCGLALVVLGLGLGWQTLSALL